MADDEFWSNRFHACALAAGFIAAAEGRLDDSRYVRDLAYGMYEDGAFTSGIAPLPAIAEAGAIRQELRTMLPKDTDLMSDLRAMRDADAANETADR